MNADKSLGTQAGEMAMKVLDGAIGVGQPAIDAYIGRARRRRPDASPAEIGKMLQRDYLAAVTSSGGVAGATAFLPTGASLATAGLDLAGFMSASSLYVLALGQLHGVRVDDLERRRMLVMASLLGDAGSKVMLEKVAPRVGAHWGKIAAEAIPMAAIQQVNKVLGPRFVTRYGTRQGVLVLGKQRPLGFGAAIGASGNAAFGYGVVKAARQAFGRFPPTWDHLDQN